MPTFTATAEPTDARIRLNIDWSDVPAVTDAEVNRLDPDGRWRPVRGAEPYVLSSGLGVVYDYEAPFNEPVSYQLSSSQVPGGEFTSSTTIENWNVSLGAWHVSSGGGTLTRTTALMFEGAGAMRLVRTWPNGGLSTVRIDNGPIATTDRSANGVAFRVKVHIPSGASSAFQARLEIFADGADRVGPYYTLTPNAWNDVTAEFPVSYVDSMQHWTIEVRHSSSPNASVTMGFDLLQQGSTSWPVTPEVTLTSSTVWLKHPLLPSLNQPVMIARAPDLTYAARRTLHRVLGRSTPIAVTDIREAGSGDIAFYIETVAERDALESLFADGSVLLLAGIPEFNIGNWFISTGDVTYAKPARVVQDNIRIVDFPFDIVDRPVGLTGGGADATYALIPVVYASYSTMMAGEPTYLDLLSGVGT